MGFQSSRPGYVVRVDGLLLGESRFVIRAAVEYGEHLSQEERWSLSPLAQLELLLAIEGEKERAHRLGADVVHVGVIGDEPLYRYFRTSNHLTSSPGPFERRAPGPSSRRSQPPVVAGRRSRSLEPRARADAH